MPHNHQMWAVIGVYTGREDNIFWRRVPGGDGGKLEAAGARALSAKDADPLGDNIIHSVTNPIPRLTGAIHVYGGDFFAAERSEWDPGDPSRGPLRCGQEHEAVRRRQRGLPGRVRPGMRLRLLHRKSGAAGRLVSPTG